MRSSRYDRAIFWLALAGAVIVIGGIVGGGGVTQVATHSGVDLWSNGWFRAGAGIMVAGILMLWWALTLYIAHRHAEGHVCPDPDAHKLRTSGPLMTAGTGPEVLSVLRTLRADLKDAARKIERSSQKGKFWSAGTEGDLRQKTWQKTRKQLQSMSGMNPLWDTLEEAYAQVERIAGLRTSRVFSGYRVQPDDDDLDGALASVHKADTALEAKIADLDQRRNGSGVG